MSGVGFAVGAAGAWATSAILEKRVLLPYFDPIDLIALRYTVIFVLPCVWLLFFTQCGARVVALFKRGFDGVCDSLSATTCALVETSSGECAWDGGSCKEAALPHWVVVLCVLIMCAVQFFGGYAAYQAIHELQVALVIVIANAGTIFLVWLASIWVFPQERGWLLNPVSICGIALTLIGITLTNIPRLYETTPTDDGAV